MPSDRRTTASALDSLMGDFSETPSIHPLNRTPWVNDCPLEGNRLRLVVGENVNKNTKIETEAAPVETFGDRLQRWMKQDGVSIHRLQAILEARGVKVSSTSIHKWLHGGNADDDYMRAVAAVFGKSWVEAKFSQAELDELRRELQIKAEQQTTIAAIWSMVPDSAKGAILNMMQIVITGSRGTKPAAPGASGIEPLPESVRQLTDPLRAAFRSEHRSRTTSRIQAGQPAGADAPNGQSLLGGDKNGHIASAKKRVRAKKRRTPRG